MATLRIRTRARDGVVVGDLRYYPRPGAGQVSVSIEGEATATRYKRAVEDAIADGAPIPPPPNGRPQKEQEAMSLAGFFVGPYMSRKWPDLAAATQEKYRSCWNVHVCHPEYGISERTLSEFDANPTLVQEFKSAMVARAIGRSTINNTLGLLGSIFTQAQRTPASGLRHHPIKGGIVTYESTQPDEPAMPHPPIAVGMVAAEFRAWEDFDALGSQLYMLTMTCCGLRPGEARALRLTDVREHTLFVNGAIDAMGNVKETKNTKWRYPPVPAFLRDALRAYARGREFIWPQLRGKDAQRDWSKRVLASARASVAGEQKQRWPDLGRATAYDLGRHSFAAVYLRAGWWDGHRRRELADWMGHDVRTLESHYAGLIAEYQHDKPINAGKEFAAAWSCISDAVEESLASRA